MLLHKAPQGAETASWHRRCDVVIVGITAVACTVLVFPSTTGGWRIAAGATILLVVCAGCLLDAARQGGRRSLIRSASAREAAPFRTSPARGHSAAPQRAAPNWSGFPTSLGPFNPDDGLDIEVSPHFIRLDE